MPGEEEFARRKRRYWGLEAVFGNIKQNMGFKRFLLRGIDKLETEIGLTAMAHNLIKATIRASGFSDPILSKGNKL